MDTATTAASRRSPWPGRIARLLRSLLVAWLISVAVVFAFQRFLVFPRHMVDDWAGWTWPGIEAVTVETADGERLRGYWKAPSRGAPVVVTFHGNGSMPEPHAARFASGPWNNHGWGVLAVGYRGYPGSTGSPSEAGILADGEAAMAYVRRRAPDAGILLHGHSLGSGVAVALAARHPVRGLYLESAYTSLRDVARDRVPFMPSSLLLDAMRSDERIGAVRAPVLMVHGADDPLIPSRIGRRLAERASPPPTFLEIPGDHMSILGERDDLAEATFRIPAPGASPAR